MERAQLAWWPISVLALAYASCSAPAATPTTCTIDGVIYSPGDQNPLDTCQACVPAANSAGWTDQLDPDGCYAPFAKAGAISIAATHSGVFWVNEFPSCELQTKGLTGGKIRTLAQDPTGFCGLHLSVDETNAYWTTGRGYEVVKVPIDGGPTSIIASLSKAGSPVAALASDGVNVYWSTSLEVSKVPVNGGSPTTLATGFGLQNLAADGHHVYLVAAETIEKVSVDGGPATTLASGQFGIESLTIDDENVYWTAINAQAAGVVVKVPKAGGTPVTLANEPGRASSIAVNSRNAYWVQLAPEPSGWCEPITVFKVPLTGSKPVPLIQPCLALGLAASEKSLYVATYGIFRLTPD